MSSNKNWDKDGGILDLKPGVRTVGTKNRAVRDRQDSTPDARTEDLLGILFRITKAVERACHEDSRIFIDKQFFHRTVTEDGKVITIFRHGAWVFLYNPLSGIAQILKSIGSDASRYAWTVRHLLVVGEFNLSEHSSTPSWRTRRFSLLIQSCSRGTLGFDRAHGGRKALPNEALLRPLQYFNLQPPS